MTRVLVVDDKAENLYLLRSLLQGHGYEVEEARHGAEALAKARADPPGIVISDLLMPVMDGYTLLRYWKADGRLKAIPFVVYTATYTEPGDEQLALDLGADAFIVKPAEPAPFMARVNEVLAKARQGEFTPAQAPGREEKVLLKEYSEILVRKLEEKALQLEQSNRELLEDIARREKAETETDRLLEETERARAALLSIMEDERANKKALIDRERSYSTLVKNITGAVYRCRNDNQRTIEFISEGCFDITGYRPEELLGNRVTSLGALMHPEDAHTVWEKCQANLAEGKACSNQYRILHRSGEVRWVWDQAQGIEGADGELTRIEGLLIDITQNRRAEREHAAALARFEKIFHAAPLASAISTLAGGRLVEVNSAYCALVGRPRDALLGRTVAELELWSDLRQRDALMERLRHERRVHAFEAGVRAGSGEQRTLLGSAEVIDFLDEPCVLMIGADITERVRAEQALRELARRLVETEETERSRINRELHDRFAANLAAASLGLASVGRVLPAEALAAAGPQLDEIRKLIAETLAQSRDLMAQLSPPALADFGLLAALRAHAEAMKARTGFEIAVEGQALEPRLPIAVETALFRIAQEALANAAKHGGTGRAEVRLQPGASGLELAVRDEGAGFDPAAPPSGPSWGLRTMHERAEAIGAALTVKSSRGAGTLVTLTLPKAVG